MEGGLHTGSIYEFSGSPVSGKTQLCLTIASNVAHNLKQHVYYLDSKGSFTGRRVKQILEFNNKSALETEIVQSMLKILVKRVNTIHELINCLYALKQEILGGLKLRVAIINSLPSLIYGLDLDITTRNGLLNKSLNAMRLLATEHHMVFIVTNLVTNWYEGPFGKQTCTEKLGLGKYWSSVPDTRLVLKVAGENKYQVSVAKSIRLRAGKSCTFEVTEKGAT